MQINLSYEVASASISVIDQVGVVTLRGVITDTTLLRMLQDTAKFANALEIRAFVADWRSAVFGMSQEQFGALRSAREVDHPTFVPTAFLATGETLDLLREHSVQMIDHGLLRIATSQPCRALNWAQEQVAFSRLPKRMAVVCYEQITPIAPPLRPVNWRSGGNRASISGARRSS